MKQDANGIKTNAEETYATLQIARNAMKRMVALLQTAFGKQTQADLIVSLQVMNPPLGQNADLKDQREIALLDRYATAEPFADGQQRFLMELAAAKIMYA